MTTDPIREMRRRWDERWDGGLPAEAATQLMRINQLLISRLDSIVGEFGLTMARYEALVLLSFSQQHEMPLSKLGRRLMIHPASVTNIVDRLADQGYVDRIAHPTDRRVVLARVTDEGRQVTEQATKAIIAAGNGLEGLTDKDLRSLISISTKYRAAIGDLDVSSGDGDGDEPASSATAGRRRMRTTSDRKPSSRKAPAR